MIKKKTFNLVLMLCILVIYTFALSYWLSNDSKGKSKKIKNNSGLNLEKKNAIPVLKLDSNNQKLMNASALLRQ